MSFRIDILSSDGLKSGPPITEVLGLSVSDMINQVGEATITIPAAIAAQRGLARGNRYQIYNDELGYLGEYTHYDSTVDAAAKNISIVCRDSLIRIAERVAGFRRNFNNAALSTVLTDLLDDFSPTWSASYEGETITDPITFSVEGENYLRILNYLRTYVRGWFRRETDTSILFGKFTSTTPVVTFVSPTMVLEGLPTTQALIMQITRTRAGSDVVNRVYPVGAGIGETKLDLRYSSRTTPYTVESGVVGGGVAAYWLEDAASVASYGRVDRVVAWNEIRPISNSAADLTNAANALYDIATAYLQRYNSENDAYTLSAVEVPASLRVGDLVRIVYNGVAELENGRVGWLNVANNFFVTRINRDFDDSANSTVSLNISANGDAIVGNTEILYDILADVQTLKLRTQPTQTYYSKASPTMPLDSAGTTTASFAFTIGSEVLEVNQMSLEFELSPLRTFATSAAAGGAQTVSSSSGGSSTPTSSTLAAATPTSSTLAASTPTSSTLAAATPTSSSSGSATVGSQAGLGHQHAITVKNTATLPVYAIYVDTGTTPPTLWANSGADRTVFTATESAHTHDVVIGNHSHTVTVAAHSHTVSIPAHSHTVSIPAHDHDVTVAAHSHTVSIPAHDHTVTVAAHSHTVSISAHTHDVTTTNHTHNLTYGVNTDSVSPVVTITVDGMTVSGITKLSGSGSTLGTSATGPGVFSANIISQIKNTEFRGSHTIVFTCTTNRGTVFAQLLSRVTIQPIAV